MAALVFAACAKLDVNEPVIEEELVEAPANSVPGVLYVKMKSELTDLNQGMYTFHPAFYIGGKFEKRQREEGLHLWYVASFTKEILLTKAAEDLNALEGAEIVEYVPRMTTKRSFNDKHWGLQWDLYNDGVSTNPPSEKLLGCDVNVTKAWDIVTGSSDVIVAICDSGVEYTHEDLAANMWVNEAELNGAEGVDDDANGIVDDIYGSGFMADKSGAMVTKIAFGDHGTHIAGVISAVNNNGKGISGIAGGDGTPGTGVRIMTLDVNNPDYDSVFIGRAFQYAADNGAVIMNCSWEYEDVTETPALTASGIRYFTKYAGLDENDVQVGPMAGGLCIFAAGNESAASCYPAMDDNVLAVSSVGADYVAAYYTNYGDWVDVAAPGGDAKKKYEIYSTITGNSYGYMQGTSMACPHAVGVAALVVSKYKGQGFTRDMLFNILVNTANPVIKQYNNLKLGSGLVDAYAAVTANDSAPEKPASVTATPLAGAISVSVKQTKNSSGKYPDAHKVFVSEKSLASLDPAKPGTGITILTIPGDQNSETVSIKTGTLKFKTKYNVRVAAVNSLGKFSGLSEELSTVTLENHVPVIKPLDPVTITMKSHETATMRFELSDEDGQDLTISLGAGLEGASVKVDGMVATVTIDALQVKDGMVYTGNVIVSDGMDEAKTTIKYTVEENRAPVVSTSIPNLLLSSLKENTTMDLSKYFTDPDGETLSFETTATVANIVTLAPTVRDNSLSVSAKSYGTTLVKVIAIDARGKSATASFTIVVRDGSREIDLYPNPVSDYLYIRTPSEQTADIKILTGSGAAVYSAQGQAIDPFNPLMVDMTAVSSGEYYVQVKTASSVKSYPIVKR